MQLCSPKAPKPKLQERQGVIQQIASRSQELSLSRAARYPGVREPGRERRKILIKIRIPEIQIRTTIVISNFNSNKQ